METLTCGWFEGPPLKNPYARDTRPVDKNKIPIHSIRPLPSIFDLENKYKNQVCCGDATVCIPISEFRQILETFRIGIPFDVELYRERHHGFSAESAERHWFEYGYIQQWPLYGWEGLPWNISEELRLAPQLYFDLIRAGCLSEFREDYDDALLYLRKATTFWRHPIAATFAIALLLQKVRLPALAYEYLLKAKKIEPGLTVYAALEAEIKRDLNIREEDKFSLEELSILGVIKTDIHENTFKASVWQIIQKQDYEKCLLICEKIWFKAREWHWISGAVLCASRHLEIWRGLTLCPQREVAVEDSYIPHSIFQFWDSEEIPDDVMAAMNSWREKNPDFNYIQFNDSSAKEFLTQYFDPEILDMYEFCYHAAMKADFFRLAYLIVFGGFYIDADEFSGDSLDTLLKKFPGKSSFFSVSPDNFFINNRFIGATPQNPDIIRIFDHVISVISDSMHNSIDRPSIWNTTGPGAVSFVMAKAILIDRKLECGLLYHHIAAKYVKSGSFKYKKTESGNWMLASGLKP